MRDDAPPAQRVEQAAGIAVAARSGRQVAGMDEMEIGHGPDTGAVSSQRNGAS